MSEAAEHLLQLADQAVARLDSLLAALGDRNAQSRLRNQRDDVRARKRIYQRELMRRRRREGKA